MSADLLVELFTEELPPKALRALGTAFGERLLAVLTQLQLTQANSSRLHTFATPRRLAALIPGALEMSAERLESRKLMPVKVAFDVAGKPSAALLKKLEKEGGTLEGIERKTEGDAEYVFLNQRIAGMTLEAGLQTALNEAIAKLPIPKVMSYQLTDGTTTVKFVRPAHGLVALHGDKVLNVHTLGLKAGRITRGHRFQGARDISLQGAGDYETKLAEDGQVIADFDRRRDEVAKQLAEKARTLAASLGAQADYAPLLDEVTALVEYPTVYEGEFEAGFLAVPQECLILTMRQNQKYFPLFDANGKLTNRFLIVSNMKLADPKNIVEGNQRVVRPRLADARFFFETDKKAKLADRVAQLDNVVYHNKLGSQLDRVKRVRELAKFIAQKIGADPALAGRAALLAKADLVTSMVGEFPELQGTMGRYYALADGEEATVADAIEQHYRPRFAGDLLPEEKVAIAVALADKLEALVGMFSVGQQPTGDKDPLGLRRQALGIVRILVEKSLKTNLGELLEQALTVMGQPRTEKLYDELLQFIRDRLRGWLRDQGFLSDEIESVVEHTLYLNEVIPCLNAVKVFKTIPEGKTLAAAHKRIRNILLKTATQTAPIEPSLGAMRLDAEKHLFTAMQSIQASFNMDNAGERLKELAQLGPRVDAFFEEVMVMDEDATVRENRIALLRKLEGQMNQVVDISKLAT